MKTRRTPCSSTGISTLMWCGGVVSAWARVMVRVGAAFCVAAPRRPLTCDALCHHTFGAVPRPSHRPHTARASSTALLCAGRFCFPQFSISASHITPCSCPPSPPSLTCRHHRSNQRVHTFLDELFQLKKPNCLKLSRKNEILPFEDEAKLEFLAHRNDASLFCLGSSTKKRPDNVVMGRLHDFHVLDMIEFGFDNFKSMRQFSGANSAPGVGMRPCFVFCGSVVVFSYS